MIARTGLALAALLALAHTAPAFEQIAAPLIESRAGEVLVGELILIGETIDIKGAVSNDLFIAGGAVSLSGAFADDLWVFGRDSIRLSGTVGDDARLAGRTADIEGRIAGNLAVAASSVRLGTGAVVLGDASITADDVILLGDVLGNLHITAARVTLGGRVVGNVTVHAASLIARPELRVDGDLQCTLPEPIRLDPRIRIGGATLFRERRAGTPWPMVLSLYAGLYVGGVFAGLPFVFLFPRFASHAALRLRTAWPRALLGGMAGLFVIPAAAIFAFSWMLTTPLGAVLTAGYALAAVLAPAITAIAIGGAIFRLPNTESPPSSFAALSAGMIPLVLAAALPGAALTILLATVCAGTGAFLALLRPARRPPPPPPPLPPESAPQG